MVGPTGIVGVIGGLTKQASNFQSGQINHYSLVVIIGTIVFLLIAQ